MAVAAADWRLRVSAIVAGIVLALGLGEGFLRVARPDAVSIVRYPCAYRPDPETGYGYVPYAEGIAAGHFEFDHPVAINGLGFYDDEPLPKGEANPRILAVGDSFTAALNLDKPRVWTSVLERELRESGFPKADVVNVGIDGSGTGAHVALIERYVREFAPQIVLLAFYANDVEDVLGPQLQRECHRGYVLAYPSERYRDALRANVDAHLEKRVRRWIHAHSYLARLVAAAWLPRMNPYRIEFLQPRLAAIEPKEPRQVGVRRWRQAMASLGVLAETCDCRLLVVPVPPGSDARGSLDIWSRRGNPALELFDVLPALEEARAAADLSHEDLYFVHDRHFNALGNDLFGRALARRLALDLAR